MVSSVPFKDRAGYNGAPAIFAVPRASSIRAIAARRV